MIYFAQPVGGGPIKIGFSNDVGVRLKNHEWYYGRPMVLLGTMPGDRPEEKEIHERFAHLRFGRTEQFRPAAELMEFIGRPLLVSADPDAVEAMPTPLTRVRLDLDPDEHRFLRVAAAEANLSMAMLARKLVRDAMKQKPSP